MTFFKDKKNVTTVSPILADGTDAICAETSRPASSATLQKNVKLWKIIFIIVKSGKIKEKSSSSNNNNNYGKWRV